MSRKRIVLILLVILTGLNIGLLWDGGPESFASPEWGNGTGLATISIDESQPGLPVDGGATVALDGVVPIRRADSILGQVSAAGTIELISKREVVLEVAGTVRQVAVGVGDQVVAGQPLLFLEDTGLLRAVERAKAELATRKAELEKLQAGSDPGEIAASEAKLLAAQENLTRVAAGATPEELAAAESKLNAAKAKYAESQAGPSGADLEEARAELEKADIERQQAQREYDKVAWRNDVGMTHEAAQLHKATVEYEKSVAKFNRVNQPKSQSQIQAALGDMQQAEHELELLRLKPTGADLADAQAKVADAQQQLDALKTGPSAAKLQDAESRLVTAQLDLEEAEAELAHAQIVAPISGTVLSVELDAGQRGTVGTTVATLADTSQLKLTVNLAEIDVPNVELGQMTQIAIDALQGKSFTGVVEQIAPINREDDQDVVNYPVTIRLTGSALEDVRPGMNAVATIENKNMIQNEWLVPKNAIRQLNNGRTTIMVQRGESFVSVNVSTGETRGEWTAVTASELTQGDLVLGTLASYVDEDDKFDDITSY